MSAWIVPKAHIDYMVSAGWALGRRNRSTLRWFDSEPDTRTYSPGIAITVDSVTWANQHRRELDLLTAGQTGAMLWAENRRSVNHRYAEDELEEVYEFRQVDTSDLDPVRVLRAISCYEYQSCEHPDWQRSEAWQFCHVLKESAIDALGEPKQSAWPIEESDIRYMTGISLMDLMNKNRGQK